MVIKGIGTDWYLILKGCCPKHHWRGRLKRRGGNLLFDIFPRKKEKKKGRKEGRKEGKKEGRKKERGTNDFS
jgi:hypothetical protein